VGAQSGTVPDNLALPTWEIPRLELVMRSLRLMTALLLAGGLAAGPALAAPPPAKEIYNRPANQVTTENSSLADAQALLQKSTAVVRTMETDPSVVNLMKHAKGIFIMPDFGRAAFIVGGRWGTGVLMKNNHGRWSDPAFFSMGGGTLGLQVGASGGPVAFLLMTPKAMNQFRGGANYSLNAEAGFNIVNYSAATSQASWGKGDVVVWTNLRGAYAGIRAGITDITFDSDFNKAVYGTGNIQRILSGGATAPKLAINLRKEMPPGIPTAAVPARRAAIRTTAQAG
jgi:SH3 domain-containing YSC84-like protein 1